jgi:hypothetical protein
MSEVNCVLVRKLNLAATYTYIPQYPLRSPRNPSLHALTFGFLASRGCVEFVELDIREQDGAGDEDGDPTKDGEDDS